MIIKQVYVDFIKNGTLVDEWRTCDGFKEKTLFFIFAPLFVFLILFCSYFYWQIWHAKRFKKEELAFDDKGCSYIILSELLFVNQEMNDNAAQRIKYQNRKRPSEFPVIYIHKVYDVEAMCETYIPIDYLMKAKYAVKSSNS